MKVLRAGDFVGQVPRRRTLGGVSGSAVRMGYMQGVVDGAMQRAGIGSALCDAAGAAMIAYTGAGGASGLNQAFSEERMSDSEAQVWDAVAMGAGMLAASQCAVDDEEVGGSSSSLTGDEARDLYRDQLDRQQRAYQRQLAQQQAMVEQQRQQQQAEEQKMKQYLYIGGAVAGGLVLLKVLNVI